MGGGVVVLDCGNVGQTCDAGGGRLVCLYWADIIQYIISEQAIKCIKCPPTHSNRPNVGLQRGREACSGCHIKSVIDKPEQNDNLKKTRSLACQTETTCAFFFRDDPHSGPIFMYSQILIKTQFHFTNIIYIYNQ